MKDKIKETVIYRVWQFYLDGFKDLSVWGRSVWIIILIKLFILFVIIRLFFMPDFLKKNYKTEEQRSRHVLETLTTSNQQQSQPSQQSQQSQLTQPSQPSQPSQQSQPITS